MNKKPYDKDRPDDEHDPSRRRQRPPEYAHPPQEDTEGCQGVVNDQHLVEIAEIELQRQGEQKERHPDGRTRQELRDVKVYPHQEQSYVYGHGHRPDRWQELEEPFEK